VQYARNVWHHPLIAVGRVSDFLVMDREGDGINLEEADYDEPYLIAQPAN
jgi:ureidoglycolate lyase